MQGRDSARRRGVLTPPTEAVPHPARRAEGDQATFSLAAGADGATLAILGDWTATGLADAPDRLSKALAKSRVVRLDLGKLNRIDTAGVVVLCGAPGLEAKVLAAAASAVDRQDLLDLTKLVEATPQTPGTSKVTVGPIRQGLIGLGRGIEGLGHDTLGNLAFYGELLIDIGKVLRHPRRLRGAATVGQIERAGLDAIPIIASTNAFVGATVAFLGANLLTQFGASVLAVELVGVAVLREFAVLITAIILAGRSASSFAAEIGAMKMNQEIDAMRVMGVDPFNGLVLPRFMGMLMMTPLLTLVGMISGLAGGMLVLWPVLDLSPQFFMTRIVDNVGLKQFWLGMSKAPVMAVVVAAIGCRQGFATGADVNQLGRHVTSAVVQALFAIIVIDAAFALVFLELNL